MDYLNRSILTPTYQRKFDELKASNNTKEIAKYITTIMRSFADSHLMFDENSPYYASVFHSLLNDGFDTTYNKFLLFSLNCKPVYQNLNSDRIKLILNFFKNEDVKADNEWLYKPEAYTSDYKLKALAFLSSKQATRFGDNPDKLISKVLEATNDETIKRLLSEWQSKSGGEASIISFLKSIDSLKFNAINYDVNDTNGDLVKEAIKELLSDSKVNYSQKYELYKLAIEVLVKDLRLLKRLLNAKASDIKDAADEIVSQLSIIPINVRP